MSCLTRQMKLEAIKNEKQRLQELDGLGMDVDDAMAAVNKITAALGNIEKVREVLEEEGELETVGHGEVARINLDKPKYRGTAVEVVAARVVNGKVKVDFKYPTGKKVYTNIDGSNLVLNQTTVDKLVLYSAPNDTTSKKGKNILKSANINNITEVLNVFDQLDSIDNIEDTDTEKTHTSKLKALLTKVLGSGVDVIPEMGVFLDEQAGRNSGQINVTPGNYGIFLTKGSDMQAYGGEMRLTEKYAHEMMHAVMHWALASTDIKAVAIKNRLIKLHEQAMKKLTWQMLLPDVSINAAAEEAVAKSTYGYLNSSKNALEEFMAYATTNAKVGALVAGLEVNMVEREPKGFIEKLVYWAEKLFNLAVAKWRREPKSMKGDELVIKMVMELSRINNEATRVAKLGLGSKIEEYVEGLEDRIKEVVGDKLSGQVNKNVGPEPRGSGKIARAKWFISNFVALVGNKKNNPLLKNVLAGMFMKPEGLVQTFIQQLKETDDYQDMFEELALLSVQVDRNREGTADAMADVVGAMFKKLNSKAKKVIYAAMLELDGAVVVSKYKEKAAELYRDSSKLQAEIDINIVELKKSLSGEMYRYAMYQINGLAEYMKTGEGSLIQRKNAVAIAMLIEDKRHMKDVSPELVKLIDETTSLIAISNMDQTLKDETANMLEGQLEGMMGVASLVKGFQDYMDGRETDDVAINNKKGYVRETYDNYTTTTTAPVADEQEMDQKGYKLVKRLPRGTIGSLIEMGLYVNKNMVQLPFNRQVVRYVGDKQHGRTLFENYYKAESIYDGGVLKEKTKQAVAEGNRQARVMLEGVFAGRKVKHDKTIMPHLSRSGTTIDFVYVTSSADKIQHMGLSVDGVQGIARTWAHQVDIEESQALNAIAWDEMVTDYAKNYNGPLAGANSHIYVTLSNNGTEESIKDILRILPPEYKKRFAELRRLSKLTIISDSDAEGFVGSKIWGELTNYEKDNLKVMIKRGEFAVRRDMLNRIFGFRDLSVVNMAVIKHFSTAVKTVIKALENMWKEVVGMYKVNVILKTIEVPIHNVIGNMLWLLTEWFHFADLIRWQIEGAKGLTQWIKDENRSRKLVGLIAANPNNKEYRLEYDRLQLHMQNNPVKVMIDAGLYTHINEDLGTGDLVSSNRFTRWVDKKTEGAPEFIKTAGNYLFITEKTAVFRAMQKFTIYGDFVAKYAKYQLDMKKAEQKVLKDTGRAWTAKEKQRMSNAVIRAANRTFINYTEPDSALWQYVQDMGLSVFSKYAIRIQNIVRNYGAEHPLKMILAISAQEAAQAVTGLDATNPVEYSFLAGHGFFMPGPSGIMEQLISNAVPWTQLTK